MQTSLYLKNKKNILNSTIKNKQEGFTLLECILAIGILSIVVASVVGLQSSIISVTQIASDSMRASWAARSAISQMQYIVDVQGQAEIPEKTTVPWETDNQFTTTITRKELKDVKVSHFLTSSLGVYNLVNPGGNENLDVDKMLASVTGMLDSTSGTNPKGIFSNVVIEVKWTSGVLQKTIEEGFFFIDKKIFTNMVLPDFGGSKNNSNNSNNTPSNNNQNNGGP
ncbi:type IV pilus modification PilV family protein [Silvanigrella aquatica]|uniref:Prepilin-type N-terminal cleavage/methylation domain-containing protein n=1 Tax=Silvanigrella aquatica TaxID=1915309 RepID=A0A1L4CZ83_9BACT|nr:type II secretion system protein [Silvanigrella aquatica]APJ03273.1 hypothetical protein AXG55_04895 [Silvanigrella aquatica]